MKPANKEAPFKKRYLYKLISNVFSMLTGIIVTIIVPRALGPQAYGNYNYLTNFFNQIVAYFNMETVEGFYAKLSRDQKDRTLVPFYLCFIGITLIALVIFLIVSFIIPLNQFIWPNQLSLFIVLAAGWSFMNGLSQILVKINDAYGLTIYSEKAKIIQRLIMLALIILVFSLGGLNLLSYFHLQYIIQFILVGSLIWVLYASGHLFYWKWKMPSVKIIRYVKEFYSFSQPLYVYALIALFLGLFDRWLLQLFGGSVQQGYFGLSYNIGAFCILFTGAMQPLLMREYSIAYGKMDINKMAVMFRKYIPLLYSIAAYFACFIAIQAGNMIYIFGGESYSAAIIPVTIMAFYPIHQTYGQLSSSLFYATGQTPLYRNIGIVFALIELPLTYLLIAPTNMYGLNLGATGLAIKMVAIQLFAVNVELYYNAKYLKISLVKYLGHQLLAIICLLSISGISAFIVNYILGSQSHVLSRLFITGFTYTVFVLILASYFPIVFGLKKSDVESMRNVFSARLQSSKQK